MSNLNGIKPISKAQHGISEEILKEFALAVLLSNNGDQMSFRASDLAECANTHAGVAVRAIASEVLGEEKIIVFTLIPKEEAPMVEPVKSNIILLNQ